MFDVRCLYMYILYYILYYYTYYTYYYILYYYTILFLSNPLFLLSSSSLSPLLPLLFLPILSFPIFFPIIFLSLPSHLLFRSSLLPLHFRKSAFFYLHRLACLFQSVTLRSNLTAMSCHPLCPLLPSRRPVLRRVRQPPQGGTRPGRSLRQELQMRGARGPAGCPSRVGWRLGTWPRVAWPRNIVRENIGAPTQHVTPGHAASRGIADTHDRVM